MKLDISLLHAVVAVAKAGGFREAARVTGSNPSRMSDAVRRAEQQLGIRLFHRTTRSVSLTDAGRALMARLMPAMNEMESALDDINRYRDTPSGTLRLNVPISVSRLILPTIVPAFLARYPDIQLEIVAESNVQDVFREGCDAGIRYNEKLEQDVIAVPIGPRKQRFALAASADYLNQAGRPTHPHHLIQHRCLRGRFASGVEPEWEFEREGENVRVKPPAALLVSIGAGVDLAVDTAIAGGGIVYLFEEWLAPYFARGELEPILQPWWLTFPGPWLYYPDRRLIPAPLRAFIDFVGECD
ncbi:LysR family transcriptional regulator [Erwinia billingiae]|uniref:LysR family transcriptional regulator n=1 Tax=Erwinia billingiae TaxID=182337 RepID=UPI0032094E51